MSDELVKRLLDFDKVTVGDARDAALRIEALKREVEMFRETNRRMNRRVQLLEGWWQRKVDRENQQRSMYLWFFCRKKDPDIAAVEEAAYQRGYADGRDNRFNIPPRRAKPRREGGTP
jgi:hypothetical protein